MLSKKQYYFGVVTKIFKKNLLYHSPAGHNSEGVLDHSPCPQQSVVEDSIILGHVAVKVWFHQPCSHREGVVPNHEVGDWYMVLWKRLRVRQSN